MIPLFVTGMVLILMFVFYLAFSMVLQKNGQMRMEKQHKLALNYIGKTVQQQTLEEIAEELHDSINMRLCLLRKQASLLRSITSEPRQLQVIDSNNDLLDETVKELHQIRVSIHGHPLLDSDLVAFLQKEVDYLNTTGCISATLRVVGDVPLPDPFIVSNLIRIVREAVHNTLKHARAKNIDIVLVCSPTTLSLRIQDDGTGFDPHCEKRAGSSGGLGNIAARAHRLNGHLEVHTRQGRGTSIVVTFSPEFLLTAK